MVSWIETLKLASFILAIFTFILAFLIPLYGKNKRINTICAIYLIDIAFWVLIQAVQNINPSITMAKLMFAFGAFIAPLCIIIASLLADIELSKIKKLMIVLPTIVIALLCPIGNLLFTEIAIVDGNVVTGQQGILLPFYMIIYFVYVLVLIYTFFKARKTVRPENKSSLSILTIGFILTFSTGSLTNMILPSLKIYDYNSFGPLTTVPIVFAIAYAALNYNAEARKTKKLATEEEPLAQII